MDAEMEEADAGLSGCLGRGEEMEGADASLRGW